MIWTGPPSVTPFRVRSHLDGILNGIGSAGQRNAVDGEYGILSILDGIHLVSGNGGAAITIFDSLAQPQLVQEISCASQLDLLPSPVSVLSSTRRPAIMLALTPASAR